MARPRKYNPNPDSILSAIHRETFGRRAEIDAELAKKPDYDWFQQLHRQRRKCDWCPYDVALLAGRSLSDSERKAWQRAVLELERTNFIAIAGRRGSAIQLKRKGRERVRDLQKNK